MVKKLDDSANLAAAVDKTLDAMPWVEETDAATAALARRYAREIDRAWDIEDPTARTKALYLGPHLLGVLKDLGGTPTSRAAVKKGLAEAKAATNEKDSDDPVANIKQRRRPLRAVGEN